MPTETDDPLIQNTDTKIAADIARLQAWLRIFHANDPEKLASINALRIKLEPKASSPDAAAPHEEVGAMYQRYQAAYARMLAHPEMEESAQQLGIENPLKLDLVEIGQDLRRELQNTLDAAKIKQKNAVADWLKAEPTTLSIQQVHETIALMAQDIKTTTPYPRFFIGQVKDTIEESKIRISDGWAEQVREMEIAYTRDPLNALSSGHLLPAPDYGHPTVIHYSFEDSGTTTVKPTDTNPRNMPPEEQKTVRQQMDEMEAIDKIKFVERKEFQATDTIKWRFQNADITDKKVAAHANYPNQNGDVQYLIFDPSRFIDSEFYRESITHEMGHALGQKHPFQLKQDWSYGETLGKMLHPSLDRNNHTVMSYRRGDHHSATPTTLDIAWQQANYGPNMQHNACNTLYNICNTSTTTRVLWDAGGRNVIDASQMPRTTNMKDSPTINLRGDISDQDFNARATTIKVAPGVVVERVIGSQNHDYIISGLAQHSLTGGGGNDQFVVNSTGKHFITDYNFLEGDQILLNGCDTWRAAIRPDGLLHIQGTTRGKDTPPLELMVQLKDGKKGDALRMIFGPEGAEEALKATAQLSAADRAKMNTIGNELKAWANAPLPIEEVSQLNAGGNTNIRATPVQPTAPTLKK